MRVVADAACAAPGTQRRRRQLVADPITDACHDITVYEEIDLAAGACEGNGLLIDISDPANPKRIDAVADPLFAYWHGATFSNDGKAVAVHRRVGRRHGARCRATDQLSWGADAIYEIVNRKLVFRSYYKLPVAQTTQRELRQRTSATWSRSRAATSWSRPGTRAALSLVDFTDLAQPEGDRLLRPRPGHADAARRSGGFWSTYWYNGRIYGSEIARGFDTFKLTPTRRPDGGRDRRGRARRTKLERLNAQSQDRVRVCTSAPVDGAGRRHRAGDAVADARRAGELRRVHAGRGADVRGARPARRDLDRG